MKGFEFCSSSKLERSDVLESDDNINYVNKEITSKQPLPNYPTSFISPNDLSHFC